MPHARPVLALVVLAMLVTPGVASLAPAALPAPDARPLQAAAADPRDVLRLLGERLAHVDGGALRDLAATRLAGPGEASLLRLPTRAPPSSSAASAEATPLPQPRYGEHVWVNDSHVLVTRLWIGQDTVVTLRNSTLTIGLDEDGWPGYVSVNPGGVLVLENSTVQGVQSGWDISRVYGSGTVDAYNTTFSTVELYLQAYDDLPGSTLVERATFTGHGGTYVGNRAIVRESLFYNRTGTALDVGTNGTATGNTLVKNGIGLSLSGENAVATGNSLRFNLIGATWSGAANVTFRGNNIHDNYQDGLYSSAAGASATLDAGGNWWDGAPNVDGDSWGGAGVSVSPHSSAPFPVPDRASELPFRLRSLRGDQTWPSGAPLDGPVIARGGTLSFGAGVVEAHGFPVGSHVGARLQVVGTEFRSPQFLFSRSDDSFGRMTVRGGDGIVAFGGSPTVRDSRFVNVFGGMLVSVRALGDTPPSATVENTRFENATLGVLALLTSTTLRGNTFTDSPSGIGFLTALCPTVVVENNLITDSGAGIADVLSQTFTASDNSVYNSAIGMLLGLTASPSVREYEGRFNLLDTVVIGSQVTLAQSNLYDSPLFGVYVADLDYQDPETGANVSAQGRAAIDPTTYVSAPTSGSVTFVPPRKAAPSATPGRTASYAPTILGPGESLVLTGERALAGPVIVRQGGSLRIEDATVSPGRFAIGAMPGGAFSIQNSTIVGGPGVVVHSDGARLDNATFSGLRAGVYLVESQSSTVRGSRFLDGSLGLSLWDSTARVSRSLFATDTGLSITNETWPRRGNALVEESVFTSSSTAVVGAGNPQGTLRSNSFESPTAIDNTYYTLRKATSVPTGSGVLDARGSWFGSPSGPSTWGNWTDGGMVRWPEGAQTVLYEPWRTSPFRASFEPIPPVVTDLAPVALRDTSFDLDGAIAGRLWDFGDGQTSSETHPTHVFAQHGPLTVRLEVTDTLGRVSNATADVLVKAVPRVVATGPASVLSLVEAEFDASASFDPDGGVAAWRFRTSDGIDTGFTPSSTLVHAFSRPGLQNVTVTAEDDEGYVGAPAVVQVLVKNRAPIPSLTVSHPTPTRADTITFRSTSADLDGSIANWTWDMGDGATTLHGPVVQHRFPQTGQYAVTLTVADDLGATNTTLLLLEVTNAPPVPAFTASPLRPKPGVEVTFTSASFDPDGESVTHLWDFGDGATATGPSATHAFADEGDYLVTLSVTDADGATAALSRAILVRWNLPPVAAFDLTPGADAVPYSFVDRSRDEDGTVVAWRWEFGDGSTSTERNPRHRYLDAGVMAVSLTVTDEKGANDTLTRLVLVDDVLGVALAARPREPGLDAPLVLDVRTGWANASGVAAKVTLDVYYAPEGLPSYQWRHYARIAGQTDANGEGNATVPALAADRMLPGRYHVIATAETSLGVGGNLERASRSAFVQVAAT